MASPTAIVGYLALFAGVGFLFLFANLLVGKLLRPDDPHAEKLEVYECGEPTIGSSFVQFDLRFYVVALVFIVFDAEVAFLFPAATVFGKQTQLADSRIEIVEPAPNGQAKLRLTPAAAGLFKEMGVEAPPLDAGSAEVIRQDARRFTWYVLAETMVFFLILFVGFAYEWKRGAFDWVRAVSRERGHAPPLQVAALEEEPSLSA